jgi:transposase, IS5 family
VISLPRQAPKPRQRRADRFPLGDQPSLWESILPQEVRQLPDELARVDALLDDPAFFAPFVPYFDPRIRRPSTPMETYLRLIFLKFRYRLGYETLCREVSDSITWRCFAGSGWMLRCCIRRR